MKVRRHQPRADQTRHRILQAAIVEFSEHGLAGARTSSIAQTASVNKALLYYYFRDKEALYSAALEEVASKVAGDALTILHLPCSPGERLLRFALQHFDRIVGQQGFQALMQQEMVRFRAGQTHAMHIIAKKAFEPMFLRARVVVEEGIREGELCSADWMQMLCSTLGANVFYFLSAPLVQLVDPEHFSDPLGPAAIARRRVSAVEFLGHSLFVDRARGARLARVVLDSMPMPAAPAPEKKTA
jgi:TetR/AcrR family transcriptional regulator